MTISNRLRVRLQTESSDSLKLLRDIRNNPVCSVIFDESVPCILVLWRNYATSTQFRFVHENVLYLLRKHGLDKILGDDTDLPTIHNEDQAWLVDDWMPRAIASGLRATANKRPSAHFGKISVSNVQACLPPLLITRSFDNIEEARAWLRDA